jgi:hypothetical protein
MGAGSLEDRTMARAASSLRIARGLRAALAAGALLVGLFAVSPASAVTLNPPPPAFETCRPGGNGTVCVGNRTSDAGLEGTGIICGFGPVAFEIVDDGGTVLEHFERWYDADGNLVRRLSKSTWLDSAWINPDTGARVPYRQTNVTVENLAVPGDFASATATTTGVINFVLPGGGAIVRNAGRTIFGPDGSLEFSSGPQAILDYFVNGNAAALQPICDALAP